MSRDPDPDVEESDGETEDDPDLDGEESFPASDPPAHWSGPDKDD
jgi:hypothetical protein